MKRIISVLLSVMMVLCLFSAGVTVSAASSGILWERDMTYENTFNLGYHSNTYRAPIEDGGMHLSNGEGASYSWWYSTQNNAGGNGTAFISGSDGLTKVVIRAKSPDGCGMQIGVVNRDFNSIGAGTYTITNITIPAGDEYAWYEARFPSAVTHSVNQVAISMGSTANVYIAGIKLVTDAYVLPNAPGEFSSATPADGAEEVAPKAEIKMTFTQPVDVASFTPGTVIVNNGEQAEVFAGASAVADDPNSVSVKLNCAEGTRYVVGLNGAVSGNKLVKVDRVTAFTTGVSAAPSRTPILHYDMTVTNEFNTGDPTYPQVSPGSVDASQGGVLFPNTGGIGGWYCSTKTSDDHYGKVIIPDLYQVQSIRIRAKLAEAGSEARVNLSITRTDGNNAGFKSYYLLQPAFHVDSTEYRDYTVVIDPAKIQRQGGNKIADVRQICISVGKPVYISDIKVLPYGYLEDTETAETKINGFEMIADYGKASEEDITGSVLPEGKDITTTCNTFHNLTESPMDVYFISVLYNNGTAQEVKISSSVKLEPYQGWTKPVKLTWTAQEIQEKGGTEIKSFLWNGMTPLKNCLHLKK